MWIGLGGEEGEMDVRCVLFVFFFFKAKNAYEVSSFLVGFEMFIRGRSSGKKKFLSFKFPIR